MNGDRSQILFGPTCLPMSRTSAGRSVGDRYRAEVLTFRKAFEGNLFHLDAKRWAAPRFPSRYHKHPLASEGCGPPQAARSLLSKGIFRGGGNMFVSWLHYSRPRATSTKEGISQPGSKKGWDLPVRSPRGIPHPPLRE